MANQDNLWKVKILASTIIEMYCKDDPLYETFKTEWEFKIDAEKKIVEGLRLFDLDSNIVKEVVLPTEQQKSCYKHFINLGVI